MCAVATEYQRDIASRLGISVDGDTTTVAAARIREVVAPAIDLRYEVRPASEAQISYAMSLGFDVSNDSTLVARAKIEDALIQRNHELIRKHSLKPGARVLWNQQQQREMVISSIAVNGRLWFKGGNGWGAFPHEITLIGEGT